MNKKIAILCNTLAGSGKSIKMASDLALKLNNSNIDYSTFNNEWPNEFKNFTDLFVIGGDGTLNHFVNKYPAIELPIVVFNGGTGNDFHWNLYGNITFEDQFKIALTSIPKPVDLGKCNNSYFINGVGVGFEAAIAKALTGKKKLPGKTSFLISVFKNIFTYKSKSYTVNTKEGKFNAKYLLIDIFNGRRAGGGFYIAPKAEENDGLFDVIASKALNTFQRLRYLPVIEKGNHLKLPFISYFKTTSITIESNKLIQFHLDGEFAEADRIAISILPSQLLFRY